MTSFLPHFVKETKHIAKYGQNRWCSQIIFSTYEPVWFFSSKFFVRGTSHYLSCRNAVLEHPHFAYPTPDPRHREICGLPENTTISQWTEMCLWTTHHCGNFYFQRHIHLLYKRSKFHMFISWTQNSHPSQSSGHKAVTGLRFCIIPILRTTVVSSWIYSHKIYGRECRTRKG